MADGMKTLYTRGGAGQTVLIIPPETGVDAQGLQQTCVEMGVCCRVILPGVPAALADRGAAADPAAFTAWVRGILDGLGIQEVIVVVLNQAWAQAMLRRAGEGTGAGVGAVVGVSGEADARPTVAPGGDTASSSGPRRSSS
jgi:hypothetical protein